MFYGIRLTGMWTTTEYHCSVRITHNIAQIQSKQLQNANLNDPYLYGAPDTLCSTHNSYHSTGLHSQHLVSTYVILHMFDL
jgi:hypothetical protein